MTGARYAFAVTDRPLSGEHDLLADAAARARAVAVTLEAVGDETDAFTRGEVIRQVRELAERVRVALA